MLKYTLLLIPCSILAMENPNIIIEIGETSRPRSTSLTLQTTPYIPHSPSMMFPFSATDVKKWVLSELDNRDAEHKKALQDLEANLTDHKKDTENANTKTRVALIATVLTTLCGVTTTLVTYFTTYYTHHGSN